MAEIPITMSDLRPLMTAKINDTDVRFLVDSGAFYSMLSGASAAELKLSTRPAPFGFYVTGVGGGTATASIAMAKTFTLAGAQLHNIEFLVGGSDVGSGSIGLLGQNVLHIGDVEYDFGQGVLRLMKAIDCGKTALAYWAGTALPYSVMSIESTTPRKPFTMGAAFINGTQIRVMFDSGAGVSVLSLRAAARVGVKPDSPGVVSGGSTHGIGRNVIPSYIAPFSSFKIGDEEIRNTRLRIADLELPDADMLIGPDFFLSHRMYVANSQHKLYFTYNGGPVFNLAGAKYPLQAEAAPPSAAEAQAPESADAADYSRRGEAQASRRDFQQALANLKRACELAPDNPEYLYQRGMVYWQLSQAPAAMADFDQALKIKADYAAALLARAELLLGERDRVRAAADLDAARAAVSKESDVHFQIARDYQSIDAWAAAVAEYDLWIVSHGDDARLPEALHGRCRARAIEGVDLSLALKDCSAAIKHIDKSSSLYARVADSRALVLLRMGEFDKSIADYDASLKINPKNAAAWYGRGIDKLRKQKTADGQADIAQATALSPQIAEELSRHGIAP